jgi:hypothetical protein
MSGVLLDSCAAIWLGEGARLSAETLAAIEAAATGDGVLVSLVTGWEIGLLSRGREGRPGLSQVSTGIGCGLTLGAAFAINVRST